MVRPRKQILDASRRGPRSISAALRRAPVGAAARRRPIERLIAWSNAPRPLAAIPFGKDRGLAWTAAPLDYLELMARQAEMDANVLSHAKAELGRRETLGAL